MKKILALAMIFVFAFSSVSFAAVGSSRKSAPKPSIGSTAPKGAPSQQAAPSGSDYKPSAPSSSYSDKAPAGQAKPGMQQAAQQQTSGGFLRNAGMFAGGMLMGSMLSSMLGFGAMDGFATILGMIFNVIILAAIIAGIRYLWTKFRNNKKDM